MFSTILKWYKESGCIFEYICLRRRSSPSVALGILGVIPRSFWLAGVNGPPFMSETGCRTARMELDCEKVLRTLKEGGSVQTAVGASLVRMRAERAILERRLDEVTQAIEAKINECDHEWVRMREDGLYGERYRYCAKCDTSI